MQNDIPEQAQFVKYFKHWQIEEVEKQSNAYLARVHERGGALAGAQAYPEKVVEGGLDVIYHVYVMLFNMPILTQAKED